MSDKKKAPFWIFVMDKMKKLEIEDGQQGAVGGERDVQAVVAMVSPEWQVCLYISILGLHLFNIYSTYCVQSTGTLFT